MEVLNPRIVSPDSSLLKEIQNIINRGEGLNAAKDVEVALLTQVNFFFFPQTYHCVSISHRAFTCVLHNAL